MTSSAVKLIPLKNLSPKPAKLLSRDSNTKLIKTAKNKPIVLAGLSLMPTPVLCPSSKNAECFEPCLKNSGLAAVYKSVNESRQRKSDYYLQDQEAFLTQLRRELFNLEKYARKHDKKAVVRLNVLSDVAWETHNIPQEFPNIFMYDYTKRADRLGKTPANYKLMFSYSAAPKYKTQVDIALKTNTPITVVFKNGLPSAFLGREVIDGDKSDLDNLKALGKIVGLRAKGNLAKQSLSPFIIDSLKANSISIAA
jgi:hypothetical protein